MIFDIVKHWFPVYIKFALISAACFTCCVASFSLVAVGTVLVNGFERVGFWGFVFLLFSTFFFALLPALLAGFVFSSIAISYELLLPKQRVTVFVGIVASVVATTIALAVVGYVVGGKAGFDWKIIQVFALPALFSGVLAGWICSKSESRNRNISPKMLVH